MIPKTIWMSLFWMMRRLGRPNDHAWCVASKPTLPVHQLPSLSVLLRPFLPSSQKTLRNEGEDVLSPPTYHQMKHLLAEMEHHLAAMLHQMKQMHHLRREMQQTKEEMVQQRRVQISAGGTGISFNPSK